MVNRITVGGRLTKDIELRKTPSGISIVSFSIACERDYVSNGEKRETDFFDIVAWRGVAEFAAKYFTKGRMMIIDGRLQTRRYTDKDGNNRRAVEVEAEHIYFGDSRPIVDAKTGAEVESVPELPRFAAADMEDDGDLPF